MARVVRGELQKHDRKERDTAAFIQNHLKRQKRKGELARSSFVTSSKQLLSIISSSPSRQTVCGTQRFTEVFRVVLFRIFYIIF